MDIIVLYNNNLGDSTLIEVFSFIGIIFGYSLACGISSFFHIKTS